MRRNDTLFFKQGRVSLANEGLKSLLQDHEATAGYSDAGRRPLTAAHTKSHHSRLKAEITRAAAA